LALAMSLYIWNAFNTVGWDVIRVALVRYGFPVIQQILYCTSRSECCTCIWQWQWRISGYGCHLWASYSVFFYGMLYTTPCFSSCCRERWFLSAMRIIRWLWRRGWRLSGSSIESRKCRAHGSPSMTWTCSSLSTKFKL